MRDSGVELLKIIAVILIVISHVVLTLITENEYIPYSDYLLDCTHATTNVTVLLLAVMRHFGALGNWIFFVASAWFLLDSTNDGDAAGYLGDLRPVPWNNAFDPG